MMEKPSRAIMPIKEKIAQHLWDFEGRKIRFGVGGAWVADNWDVDDSGMRMLMRCYEEGFRYFDTSRDYGESEQVFGELVKRIDRKSIFLSTKSYFPFNFGNVQDPFKYFTDNFYQSFERLHTDHIDLFLIHDTDNIDVCTKDVIPFLREQREKGLIDYIGLGTRSIQAHNEAIATGCVDVSLSYACYSLLKKSAQSTIELSKQYQTGLVNSSVLHFGMVKSEDPLQNYSKRPAYGKRLAANAAKMQALCKEMGVDIVAASLQYSLLNPHVDITLNGIHRFSNIDSTINAMKTVIYPEQWARIFKLQEEDPCLYLEDASYYTEYWEN